MATIVLLPWSRLIIFENILEFLISGFAYRFGKFIGIFVHIQIFSELEEEEKVEIYRWNWILIFFVYWNFLKMKEIQVLKNIVEYIQKEYIESKKNS